jgi:hypothetical protein
MVLLGRYSGQVIGFRGRQLPSILVREVARICSTCYDCPMVARTGLGREHPILFS